jgi:serine acetyltransferase
MGLKDFVMVNSGTMILPDVTIGEQVIVHDQSIKRDDLEQYLFMIRSLLRRMQSQDGILRGCEG